MTGYPAILSSKAAHVRMHVGGVCVCALRVCVRACVLYRPGVTGGREFCPAKFNAKQASLPKHDVQISDLWGYPTLQRSFIFNQLFNMSSVIVSQ